jgi:hypothetical protein
MTVREECSPMAFEIESIEAKNPGIFVREHLHETNDRRFCKL